jgi:hypothetical protein
MQAREISGMLIFRECVQPPLWPGGNLAIPRSSLCLKSTLSLCVLPQPRFHCDKSTGREPARPPLCQDADADGNALSIGSFLTSSKLLSKFSPCQETATCANGTKHSFDAPHRCLMHSSVILSDRDSYFDSQSQSDPLAFARMGGFPKGRSHIIDGHESECLFGKIVRHEWSPQKR